MTRLQNEVVGLALVVDGIRVTYLTEKVAEFYQTAEEEVGRDAYRLGL